MVIVLFFLFLALINTILTIIQLLISKDLAKNEIPSNTLTSEISEFTDDEWEKVTDIINKMCGKRASERRFEVVEKSNKKDCI